MKLLLLMLLSSEAFAVNTPYYIRSVQSNGDLGGINQNFNDISSCFQNSLSSLVTPFFCPPGQALTGAYYNSCGTQFGGVCETVGSSITASGFWSSVGNNIQNANSGTIITNGALVGIAGSFDLSHQPNVAYFNQGTTLGTLNEVHFNANWNSSGSQAPPVTIQNVSDGEAWIRYTRNDAAGHTLPAWLAGPDRSNSTSGPGSCYSWVVQQDAVSPIMIEIDSMTAGVGINVPSTCYHPAEALDVMGGAQFGSGIAKSTFTSLGVLDLAPSAYVQSGSANPASGPAIVLALANGDIIGWRNFGGTGNNDLNTDNGNNLKWNGQIIANGSGQLNTANFPITYNNLVLGSGLGVYSVSTLTVNGSNFGIGTSVPSTSLDVQGNAAFGTTSQSTFTTTGSLNFAQGSTVTTNGTITISTSATIASAVPNIFMDSNGRVGISTNSPSNQMEIDTNTAVSVDSQLALKLFNRTNDLSGFAIGRGGGTNWDIYRYGSSGSDNFCIGQFGISEVECLTTAGNATFSGNVHLGTTTGTQMFRCVGGADAGWLLYGNSGAAQTLCTGGGGSLTGTGVFLP